MAEQDFPLINGQIVSWAELGLSLDVLGSGSIKTKDFAAIDFSDALDGALVPGAGPSPIGDTVGSYSAEGSITLYLGALASFQEILAAKNVKIGLVHFDIPVKWEPLDGEGTVYVARLVGCRVKGREWTNAPGPDATAVTIPLLVNKVIFNDRSLV